MNQPNAMIPPRFLFRLAAPCRYRAELWSAKNGLALGEEFRLPSWGALDGQKEFADVRTAWNEKGLAFSVAVHGKQRPLWCREARLPESDGLNLWLDARPSGSVHRASRFCHHFVFLPSGSNRNLDEPAAGQLLINRAKEQAEPAPREKLHYRSQRFPDGYLLEIYLESGALTGFNPRDYPQLGFTYLVLDAELGQQTFSIGRELPYRDDPSTWAQLNLVR